MQRIIHHTQSGFTLIELSVASLILSVGTLAVFTIILHLHASLQQLDTRFDTLQQAVLERPQPLIDRRFSLLPCELKEE